MSLTTWVTSFTKYHMKILLINPPRQNTISSCQPKILEEGLDFLPPLGLMYVAGYLEKYTGHQIKILDCQIDAPDYPELEKKLREEKPDIIGITALTFTLIDVIKTAKLAKKINPEIKVILGGPHINIYPEETMKIPEIDFLVLDEGEKQLKELVDNISNKEKLYKIKGLVFRNKDKIINTGRRQLMENLDEIPFPARHLTSYKKYFSVISDTHPVTTMFTSRGCPYKCLFCDRPHLGKIFRARSAKNVADEMEECEKMGIKEIMIYDDTFAVSRQRVLDICSEIKKRNLKIKWDARTRVNTVDPELLLKMKDAGCKRIHYGVEAGAQKILNVLKKGTTLDMVKKAFEETKKAGIRTLGYFMIGSPQETKENIFETIKLIKKINPDYVHVSITTPFPATGLYFDGLANGFIKQDYWKKFAENPTPDFEPPYWEENLTRRELLNLHKKAYKSFYLQPKFVIKKLIQLKSPSEFIRKARAGLRLLKI